MESETDLEDTLEWINHVLSPKNIDSGTPEGVRNDIHPVFKKINSIDNDLALAEVFGRSALHPDPHVRYWMLDAAMERLDSVFARQYIISQTHSDDDFVAFEAIRICGELQLQESLSDITAIVNWPSKRLDSPGKPVGVGFATAFSAVEQILDADSYEEQLSVEEYYKENNHFPLNRLQKPSLHAGRPERNVLPLDNPDPPEGMVFVPGGVRTIGIDTTELAFDRFDTSDAETAVKMYVPPFFIDKHPVTRGEYRDFLEATEDSGRSHGHPGEPSDKNRTPNTFRDGLGDDHPITGIDYYDAYAYAQWVKKDLPTEEEWETAARGPQAKLYPWGNKFDAGKLNWAETAFDTEIEDVDDWRETIKKPSGGPGVTRTEPVDSYPSGQSDFGAVDMLGNVWEYTKTNFVTRQEMYPVFSHPSQNSHENLIGEGGAFPVIRGGAWSSIPEMTTTVFRGKDLMTDRHNEIGFRCVVRPTAE